MPRYFSANLLGNKPWLGLRLIQETVAVSERFAQVDSAQALHGEAMAYAQTQSIGGVVWDLLHVQFEHARHHLSDLFFARSTCSSD